MIRAHLNGGPRDDGTVTVEHNVFYVAGAPRPMHLGLLDHEATAAESFRYGTYRLRLDGLGQPVPHDLTGTVEFQWEGWS